MQLIRPVRRILGQMGPLPVMLAQELKRERRLKEISITLAVGMRGGNMESTSRKMRLNVGCFDAACRLPFSQATQEYSRDLPGEQCIDGRLLWRRAIVPRPPGSDSATTEVAPER